MNFDFIEELITCEMETYNDLICKLSDDKSHEAYDSKLKYLGATTSLQILLNKLRESNFKGDI